MLGLTEGGQVGVDDGGGGTLVTEVDLELTEVLPEHLDGTDGLGGAGTGEAPLGLEVEELLAQFLGGGLFGGFVEVLTQLADAGEVRLLGPGQEGEEAQVVGEAD